MPLMAFSKTIGILNSVGIIEIKELVSFEDIRNTLVVNEIILKIKNNLTDNEILNKCDNNHCII